MCHEQGHEQLHAVKKSTFSVPLGVGAAEHPSFRNWPLLLLSSLIYKHCCLSEFGRVILRMINDSPQGDPFLMRRTAMQREHAEQPEHGENGADEQ